MTGPLRDEAANWPVVESEEVFDNGYIRLTVDHITDPSGAILKRSVVRPHGAVGVLAIDDQDRVVLIRQFRQPVGKRLVELPAGMLDVPGEDPLDAAKRELAEEVELEASTWEVLLRLHSSPGYSSEAWTVYVARDLRTVATDFERLGEEADMDVIRAPIEQALAAALSGDITDAMTVAALLAWAARQANQ